MNSLPKTLGIGAALVSAVLLGFVASASGGGNPPGSQVGRAAIRDLTTPPKLTPDPYTPIHRMRVLNFAMSQHKAQAELYQVPAGSRLVIEYMTLSVSTTAGASDAILRLRIGTTCAGIQAWHDVSTLNPARKWVGESKLVKIFADAGSTVQAIVEREFSPAGTVNIVFTGHLEPMSGPKSPGIG